MNITEANAVQTLARWLLDPHFREDEPAMQAAGDALWLLADRSSATLAAGLRGVDVERLWDARLTECPGCRDCDPDAAEQSVVETVQTAQGGPL